MAKKKRSNWIALGLGALLYAVIFLIRRTEPFTDFLDYTFMGETWDKYTNARVRNLAPKVKEMVIKAINRCEKELGIKVRVTDHYRSFKEQEVLYGYGRSTDQMEVKGLDPTLAKPEKKIVTKAVPGDSYHNYALAVDVVEIRYGKAIYSSGNRYDEIAKIFKQVGFKWGFDLWGFDKPHFHYSGGLSIAQLKSKKKKGEFEKYPNLA